MYVVYFSYKQGRFTIAAKHHITIAEIYESEMVNIEKVNVCSAASHKEFMQNSAQTYFTLLQYFFI